MGSKKLGLTVGLAVKICGLTRELDVEAAVKAGADYLGFVFFPPSPRSITVSRAAELTKHVPEGVTKVALCVDADDNLLRNITSNAGIDMIQFHGTESPSQVVKAKKYFRLPVMKAFAVAESKDVIKARKYELVADYLMFDAKPPQNATRPGGNAEVFDWGLVANEKWSKPWFLAGGLSPKNVVEAIRISGAKGVDVSSGVEDAPGIKNSDQMHKFIEAAKK